MDTSYLSTLWDKGSQYFTGSVAAVAALLPPYYLFEVKSAQQLGKAIPKFKLKDVAFGWRASMLPVGVAVGGQMGATGFAQRTFTKGGEEHTKAQEYLNLFMCCFGVAAASAAPLVLFNGVTAKMSLADTWRGFTFKQYVLTTSRETGFLFFMNAGERFEKEMQERYGDHWAVRYGTIFATNAFGSLLVHPFDTALTREQLSKPIRNLRQLALGAPAKSVAGGVFAVGYSASKRVLKGEKVL